MSLKAIKYQIKEILVISDTGAIKMGASIIAMVAKIRIRVFGSAGDIS